MSELVITKLSHCAVSASGGTDMILLCDRVTKDDVQVRFYEERNGHLVWEAFGDFQPNDVHKQVAICFRTPRFYDDSIQQPVLVQLQLRRPSDGQISDPRPFQFLPREVDPDGLTRKRQKIDEGSLDRYIIRDNSNLLNVKPPSPSGLSMSPQSQSQAIGAVDHSMSPHHQHHHPIAVDATIPAAQGGRLRPDLFNLHLPRMSSNSNCVTKVKSEHQQPLDNVQQSQQQDMQTLAVSPSWASARSPQQMPPPSTTRFNFTPHLNFNGDQAQVAAAISPGFIKQEGHGHGQGPKTGADFGQAIASFATHAQAGPSRHSNNNLVEGALSERLDSLDLDIDPSDLMNDLNFNNLMVMMDSGSNITFNSSGNIQDTTGNIAGTLNTPQLMDSDKNPMASAAQMARLQNELLGAMQGQPNKHHGQHDGK